MSNIINVRNLRVDKIDIKHKDKNKKSHRNSDGFLLLLLDPETSGGPLINPARAGL